LSTLRITKQGLERDLQEASTGMAISAKAMQTVKEVSEALVEANKGALQVKEDIECLELLKEAFSPRGVKAVVIDYLVPQLEERINGVLSQMSDFRIRLDTQKATVDEEGVKEGLFITVINDHQEELPFASYSGGEKVKITIAISEALASLMNQIGFRIMDENIVSLDKESTESFVVVLEKLQQKFPQLFVISHLQEVKDIFEKKITVVKVNGTSKII
jgi:exonuclease SbcC